MAWQPQEIVLVGTILYPERVHRERETYSYDRIKGDYKEWLTRCGTKAVGYTRSDDTGSYIQSLDRIWAWQAHLLGMPFCRLCFPLPDRPDGIGPTNWWRLDDR